MSRTFTREEFYELVWSKPMTHLAKEFAISDVALHKICKKHNIPNPPLGWWAKKAAGKGVQKTPLPEVKEGSGRGITLTGGNLIRELAALAKIRERARVVASEDLASEDAVPHPVVDRTVKALRRAKPSELGIVAVKGEGLIECAIAAASLDRLAKIVGRVIAAAARQGFEIDAKDRSASFKADEESIAFSITEAVERTKHVLTSAEQAKEDAWQKRQNRSGPARPWSYVYANRYVERPRFPEWDYQATGKLTLAFEHIYVPSGTAPRRSFKDGKHQRLEEMAGDIAVGLAVIAAAKREQRLEHERRERQEAERYRRLEEEARRRHVRKRRNAELNKIVSEVAELEQLRRIVTSLSAEISAPTTPRVTDFLQWAKAQLADREHQFTAAGLEECFTSKKLFGKNDGESFVYRSWDPEADDED